MTQERKIWGRYVKQINNIKEMNGQLACAGHMNV